MAGQKRGSAPSCPPLRTPMVNRNFCQKITNLNSKHIKASKDTLLQKSCSWNVTEIVYRKILWTDSLKSGTIICWSLHSPWRSSPLHSSILPESPSLKNWVQQQEKFWILSGFYEILILKIEKPKPSFQNYSIFIAVISRFTCQLKTLV